MELKIRHEFRFHAKIMQSFLCYDFLELLVHAKAANIPKDFDGSTLGYHLCILFYKHAKKKSDEDYQYQ